MGEKDLVGQHAGERQKKRKEDDTLKKVRKLETFFDCGKTANKTSEEHGTVSNSIRPTCSSDEINIEEKAEQGHNTLCNKPTTNGDNGVTNTNTEPLSSTCSGQSGPENESGSNIIISNTELPDNDPYNWVVNDETIDFLLKQGIKQNDGSDFSKSVRQYTDGRKRHCTDSLFKRKLLNGNIVKRDYLVYSPS